MLPVCVIKRTQVFGGRTVVIHSEVKVAIQGNQSERKPDRAPHSSVSQSHHTPPSTFVKRTGFKGRRRMSHVQALLSLFKTFP
jgi:hypothetical protein